MPISAPRFNGKMKKEIAAEAFRKFGPKATIQQVDAYFRKHKLPCCERSMYQAMKRIALGAPPIKRGQYPYRKKAKFVDLVVRTKQLAYDIGGYDVLKKLIEVLR